MTLIDRELFRFDEIWAAAGHPNGVFRLSPAQLEALTGAPVCDVTRAARHDSRRVPSPCISVCRMDARSGWCDGCLRTLDEIAAWSVMDDAEKRAVWKLLPQRGDLFMSTQDKPALD